MGVSPETNTLDLSITINDGFFILGTKNYSFPITQGPSDSPTSGSPSKSPQMIIEGAADESAADDEFDEIRGMYIDLKKKVVLKNVSQSFLDHKEDVSTPYPRIYSQYDACQDETDTSKICNQIITRLSSAIKEEEKKEQSVKTKTNISFDYFEKEVLEAFSNVLIVVIDMWTGEYVKGNKIKIVGAGISTSSLQILRFYNEIKSLLWLKYDILPCFFCGKSLPLDQQSESLARRCANLFGQDNLPRLSIVENNKVNVDAGNISFYSLTDYVRLMGPKMEEMIKEMQKTSRKIKKERISFFSSTPQGGGVALMRHSLIRFLTMLGIDASWYVCVPSRSVFNITKKKVHNILQAVAPDNVELTQEDKTKVDKWIKNNYESNWKKPIQSSTFIVLDDHQVARLLPYIKRDNPSAKVVYRSHIQMRAELFSSSQRMQNVWNFIWEGIKEADYFIMHPIPQCVPDNVPKDKVFFQPASTDPLDGLNKEITPLMNIYYQNVFNRICIDNGENPINFSNPYIIQIARFDPSKGIEDLLEAYHLLYMRYQKYKPDDRFCIGLVLCGHGSVDDPEDTRIFKKVSTIVESEKFHDIKHLITKVRLPPSDQLLNVVLRNAKICCQLSISEGYEVKVTEALMKNIPAIVCRVGGLPLQVTHGINGYIVEPRDVKKVSKHLYDLLGDHKLYTTLQKGLDPKNLFYITTPFHAMFWLHLVTRPKGKSTEDMSNLFMAYKQRYLGETSKDDADSDNTISKKVREAEKKVEEREEETIR
ncbi:alpha,alpha-trehalose phosphorylase (configuration-retaining) [Nematocida sp. LUAm3]|nr:alpha,alpha-trehalose phosphorylase (configuration-retaining) [Nematocida sp. LUAm3]KAI5176858.1 alpha,alpha-trehalose phosphorylase (configuration-retaining) [Nematocida sp. LUAm1]